MCQQVPNGLVGMEVPWEQNSVCRHSQASEVNCEALTCFLRKWMTGESQTGRGWGLLARFSKGAASQVFFPQTRSSLLGNCRNRSALVSVLEKHQWKVLLGGSRPQPGGWLINMDQSFKIKEY